MLRPRPRLKYWDQD